MLSTEATYSNLVSIAIGVGTVVKIVMDFSCLVPKGSPVWTFMIKIYSYWLLPTSIGHVLKKIWAWNTRDKVVWWGKQGIPIFPIGVPKIL